MSGKQSNRSSIVDATIFAPQNSEKVNEYQMSPNRFPSTMMASAILTKQQFSDEVVYDKDKPIGKKGTLKDLRQQVANSQTQLSEIKRKAKLSQVTTVQASLANTPRNNELSDILQ